MNTRSQTLGWLGTGISLATLSCGANGGVALGAQGTVRARGARV